VQVSVAVESVVGAVDRDMDACAARLKVEVRFRALASAAPRPAAYHLLHSPLCLRPSPRYQRNIHTSVHEVTTIASHVCISPSLGVVGVLGALLDFLVLFLFKLNALLFLFSSLASFSCCCSLCSRSSARRPQKSLPCAGMPYETFHLHSSNLTVCTASMRLMRVSRCCWQGGHSVSIFQLW
jgi:hypothetical protein